MDLRLNDEEDSVAYLNVHRRSPAATAPGGGGPGIHGGHDRPIENALVFERIA